MHLLKALVIISGCMLVTLISGNRSAVACSFTPEAGRWINSKAKRKDIAVVEIKTACERGTKLIRVRTYTKCAPRNCKWGRTLALRTDQNDLYAIHRTFVANRHVRIKLENPNRLKVKLWNDYRGQRPEEDWQSFDLIRTD